MLKKNNVLNIGELETTIIDITKRYISRVNMLDKQLKKEIYRRLFTVISIPTHNLFDKNNIDEVEKHLFKIFNNSSNDTKTVNWILDLVYTTFFKLDANNIEVRYVIDFITNNATQYETSVTGVCSKYGVSTSIVTSDDLMKNKWLLVMILNSLFCDIKDLKIK